MLYLLVILFLNLHSSDVYWRIPHEYYTKLDAVTKGEFYSPAQWKDFSEVERKGIRNILICKHAEVRYAPLHTIQLKIFNSFVKDLNDAITYSLKTDCASVSIKTESNPLFYWMLETNGKFLTSPCKGKLRYSAYDEGDYVYSISQEQKIVIPFIDATYEDNTLNVRTLEKYVWENNILSLSNSAEKIDSFIPLKKVHSICPLEARIYDHLAYIPAFGRTDSAGLLITLKNGIQMVWNRNEQQLYPVGFCRQFNIDEDSYDYCKRLHAYFFTINKPSQAFQRLFLKKFIWQTPQQWYWNEVRSRFFARLKNICIAAALCWGFWRGNLLYKDVCIQQETYNTALESFKNELLQKNIKIPSILGL